LPSPISLPSIGGLLHKIVGGLFGALLEALTPGFLKHADIHTLQWLVGLPDAANSRLWPHVGQLEGDMAWVAGALLPTMLVAGTIRDSALSLAFHANPANALLRFIGAVFWIILYRFTVNQALGLVNTLTSAILSFGVVGQGLHRTVLVLFGGSVLTGAGGAFLALLALVAVVFAVCMFALKVLVLIVLAALYVVGPLFIALTPLPVLAHLARGWLLAFMGVCLIPFGWCVLFATAGALSLDVTNLTGGAHIGSRVTGGFAALGTFYLAYRWPLMVFGHVCGALGGLTVPAAGATSAAGRGGLGERALATKARVARTKLQAALITGGQGLSSAAGRMGAPPGGLVGVAGRAIRARKHPAAPVPATRTSTTPTPAAGTATVAGTGAHGSTTAAGSSTTGSTTPTRGSAAGSRTATAATVAAGAVSATAPRNNRKAGRSFGERVREAAGELRQTPGRMQQAWRQPQPTKTTRGRTKGASAGARANRPRKTQPTAVTLSASTATPIHAGRPSPRASQSLATARGPAALRTSTRPAVAARQPGAPAVSLTSSPPPASAQRSASTGTPLPNPKHAASRSTTGKPARGSPAARNPTPTASPGRRSSRRGRRPPRVPRGKR
jgi:hypothetical protein